MEEYANQIEEWFREYLDMKYDEGVETPLMDTYIKDVSYSNNFDDRSKVELSEFYNILCDLASFSSRMRIEVGDRIAEIVVGEMIDEADREAEEIGE